MPVLARVTRRFRSAPSLGVSANQRLIEALMASQERPTQRRIVGRNTKRLRRQAMFLEKVPSALGLIILAAAAASASAKDIYVSPNGNDKNSGSSSSTPLGTI